MKENSKHMKKHAKKISNANIVWICIKKSKRRELFHVHFVYLMHIKHIICSSTLLNGEIIILKNALPNNKIIRRNGEKLIKGLYLYIRLAV